MSAQESFDSLKAGTVIGEKYRVSRLLGHGGMGAVYEAENTWTTRRVAIKLLHPMFSSDPTAVDRFKGEAQAATRLAHPNIVDVLDMGADPHTGALYIVQEFLDGRDLFAYFDEKKQLQPAEAAEILVPVMAALAIAHERGIIHRDIKPENIFLVNAGSDIIPKLIDFGLSKVMGETGASRKTTTGTVMGTPYYMSPEQVRGDRAIDARTDVWAMGVVLFELIAGKVPYDDASANLLMFKIMSEPPPRIESMVPGINPSVAEVIHRAMAPDSAGRYPSMREMLDAMLACEGFEHINRKTTLRERFSRSIEHRPPAVSTAPAPTPTIESGATLVRPVPVSSSVPEPRTTQNEMSGSRPVSMLKPPSRLPWAAGAAVTLVVVALAGWRLSNTSTNGTEPPRSPSIHRATSFEAPVVAPTLAVQAPQPLVTPPTDASVALTADAAGASPRTTEPAARVSDDSGHHHRHRPRESGGGLLVPVAPP